MTHDLMAQIRRLLVTHPDGSVRLNEGGCWLTWSAVAVANRVHVHAVFPATRTKVHVDPAGLLHVDAILPVDFSIEATPQHDPLAGVCRDIAPDVPYVNGVDVADVFRCNLPTGHSGLHKDEGGCSWGPQS